MKGFTRKIFSATLALVLALSFTGLAPIKAQAAEATIADPATLTQMTGDIIIPLTNGDNSVNMITGGIGDKFFLLDSSALGNTWRDYEFFFYDEAGFLFDEDVILVQLDGSAETTLAAYEAFGLGTAEGQSYYGQYLGVLDADRNPIAVIGITSDEYYSETYEFYSTSPDVDFGIGLDAENAAVKHIEIEDISEQLTQEDVAALEAAPATEPAETPAEPAPTPTPTKTSDNYLPLVSDIRWSEDVPGEFSFDVREAMPEYANNMDWESIKHIWLYKDGEEEWVGTSDYYVHVEVGQPGYDDLVQNIDDFIRYGGGGVYVPESGADYTLVFEFDDAESIKSPVYHYVSPEDGAAGSSVELTPAETPAPQSAPETAPAPDPAPISAQPSSTRTYTWGALIQIINSPESVVVEEADGWTIVNTPIGRLKVESRYVR